MATARGHGLRVPPARQGPGPIPGGLVEALELSLVRRGAGALPGDRMAPGVGSGTELAQLRPYQLGDDVRQLDAAGSARTGVAHVRLQVPERILTTWLVLDRSASMAFGTADRLKSDVAEGVADVVGRAATRHGGRLAVFTAGGPQRVLAPRGGPNARVGLRRLLAEGVAVDGVPDAGLGPVLHRVGKLARQPGFIVIVSDFRGPLDWRRPLRSLRTRHQLLAVEVRDPREERLEPAGRLALVDPETGALLEVDTSRRGLRERFAEAAAQERAGVASELRKGGADHVVLSTEGDWLRALGTALQ
ncbi:MAG: hypothetical protein QOG15_1238 [Solirubrobacteraceae bacterium]|jgi:uncharacterized protein (DUF58 family)|nr:hypothetical protein [Solirubrobacteraceae bacterium]